MTLAISATSLSFNAIAANEVKDYIITSPYTSIDWVNTNQYKAQFHAHSTNSDGANLTSEMIEDHYAKGFDILAMTDHNYTTLSWDAVDKGAMTTERIAEIEAGVGRDGRGMIGLPNTNEQSRTDHINSFFVNFNNASGATMDSTIRTVEEMGGITHINHPGRATGGRAGGEAGAAASSTPETINKYQTLFNAYNSCVGTEIVNKLDNESRSDRILWDNLLQEMMPEGRFIWGFSNDDTHSVNATGYAWNVMLLPELNVAETRKAMENGVFYSVSRIDRREGINATLPNGSAVPGSGNASTLYMLDQSTPSISNIEIDQKNDAITITGENYDSIEWIADGVKIASGPTIDLNDYEDQINSYIRAQVKSDTGIAFTQPFGVREAETELSLRTTANLVQKDDYLEIETALSKTVNSNAAILTYTFDAEKFSFASFTPAEGTEIINKKTGKGFAEITLMVRDYETMGFGDIMLRANTDLERADYEVAVAADLAVKVADGTKELQEFSAATTFTGSSDPRDINGDSKIDIFDLSDIIDAFGFTATHPQWTAIYRFMDFNNNGEIEISDIVYIARQL